MKSKRAKSTPVDARALPLVATITPGPVRVARRFPIHMPRARKNGGAAA